jgi:hypothetical protein
MLRSASGQSVVRVGTNNVSIDAEDVTLGKFFNELSDLVEIETLVLAPEAERTRVSLKMTDVHPIVGIRGMLEEAAVDYGVSGGDGGKPFRIIVGKIEKVARLSSGRSEADPDEVEPGSEQAGALDIPPGEAMGSSDSAQSRSGRPGRTQPVTGMASPGMTSGRRYATGTATPGPGKDFTPGVPPRIQSVPVPLGSMPPGPAPSRSDPGTRAPVPGGTRGVSGGAIFVTNDADLGHSSSNRQVAKVGFLLLLGLSLGMALVRGPLA